MSTATHAAHRPAMALPSITSLSVSRAALELKTFFRRREAVVFTFALPVILLTTHYLDEAETLAHRVGVIAAGRIREVGPPSELGGRGSARATVSWMSSDGRRSVETDTPAAVVTELATRFGGEVPELTVTRPSLEDIYLAMIGHTHATQDSPSAQSPAITGAH